MSGKRMKKMEKKISEMSFRRIMEAISNLFDRASALLERMVY